MKILRDVLYGNDNDIAERLQADRQRSQANGARIGLNHAPQRDLILIFLHGRHAELLQRVVDVLAYGRSAAIGVHQAPAQIPQRDAFQMSDRIRRCNEGNQLMGHHVLEA